MSNGRERTVVGRRREVVEGEAERVGEVLARIERLVVENDAEVKAKHEKRKERGLSVGGRLGKKALRKAMRGAVPGTSRDADADVSAALDLSDSVFVAEVGE